MNKTLLQELQDFTGPKEGKPNVDRTLKFLTVVRSPHLYPFPLCKTGAWRKAANYYGENWGTWGYDASIRWGIHKGLITMDKKNVIRPLMDK